MYARPYLIDRKLFRGEFYTLMIFAVIGIMLLVSAGNLVTVYLGLELLSLSSYALVALNRDARLPSEAAIKYFVLGALASGMLLYGMSMVYGASGMGGTPTLDLAQLHHVMGYTKAPNLLMFGLIFMVVGHRLQAGCRAVPHVDSRRLPGCADAGHHLHCLGFEAGCVRHGVPPAW